MIGTVFEEEEISKKQNAFNQFVKNDEGHKRFHGAFTGGFQAGFKNTCGSEEGFVPKTFISSRANRANLQQQNITDIMDDEDLGNQVIGLNLSTTQEFSSLGFDNNQDAVANALGIQQNFVKEIENKQDSIGYQILKTLKHNKKQSQKQLLEQEQNALESDQAFQQFCKEAIEEEENNPHELYQVNYEQYIRGFSQKQDFCGIGYDGLNGQNYDEDELVLENIFNSLVGKKQIQSAEQMELEQQKINRVYIDFTKDQDYDQEEDDENAYEQTPGQFKNDFNLKDKQIKSIKFKNQDQDQLMEDPRKIIKTFENNYGNLNQQFTQSKNSQNTQKINIEPIVIPADYDIYNKVKKFKENGGNTRILERQKQSWNNRVNIEKRSILLGEQEKIEQLKEKIEVKKFVKASNQEMGAQKDDEFFQMNPQKQQRYRLYALERKGKLVGGSVTNEGLSWEQLQDERKEFEELYNKQEKQLENTQILTGGDNMLRSNFGQSNTQSNNKDDKSKIFGKIAELEKQIEHAQNFRKKEKFYPEKLLCKRFGCPPPYKDEQYFKQKVEHQKQKEQRIQQRKINFETKEIIKPQNIEDIQKQKKEEEQETQNIYNLMEQYGLPTEFKSHKPASKLNGNYSDQDESFEEEYEKQQKIINDKKKEEEKQKEIEKQNQMLIIPEKKKEKPAESIYKAIFDDSDSE